MDSEVHEGIERYTSGAARTALGERWDLLSPIGLQEAARAAHEGAERYGMFNHEKGLPVHVYLNHAIRHIYMYLAGDRKEPHLGHACWGLMFACQSEQVYPHLNEGHQREAGCLPPKQKEQQ